MNDTELERLENTKLLQEFRKYLSDSVYDSTEYYEEFMQELERRLNLLTELQELEKVRRTW